MICIYKGFQLRILVHLIRETIYLYIDFNSLHFRNLINKIHGHKFGH